MAYGNKTFIAQQAGRASIKIFETESGALNRVIQTSGDIMTPPVIAGDIMTVGIKGAGGCDDQLVTYKAPHFGLQKTTPLG